MSQSIMRWSNEHRKNNIDPGGPDNMPFIAIDVIACGAYFCCS